MVHLSKNAYDLVFSDSTLVYHLVLFSIFIQKEYVQLSSVI